MWHECIHESSPAQHQALLQIDSLVAGRQQEEEKQEGELQCCPPAGEIKLKQRQSHIVSPAHLQQLARHHPALEELVEDRPQSPPGSGARLGEGQSRRTPGNKN